MEGSIPDDDALIDLPIDDGSGPRRFRNDRPSASPEGRTRTVLLGVAATIVAIVGTNVVFGNSPAPAEEPTVDDVTPDVFVPQPDPAFSGLVDGQRIVYALDSLPFSVETVTVVCLTTSNPAAPLDGCDSGTAQRHTTSPGGVITANIAVYRQITVGGDSVDCAQAGCELRTFAEKAAGVVVGRAALGWSREPLGPPPPQITVEFASTPPTIGSSLTMMGTGFPVDSSVIVTPCVLGRAGDPFVCDRILAERTVQTDSGGAFRDETVADWASDLDGSIVTCADLERACAMTVEIPGRERQPAAVALPIVAEPPPLQVVAGIGSRASRHGETVRILVTDAIDDVSVSLCATDGACVRLLEKAPAAGALNAIVTVVQTFAARTDGNPAERIDCALVPCELSVSDGREAQRIPLTFDGGPPPTPTLALVTDEPVQLSDTVTIIGTGFTPTSQPAEIRLLLCPPGLGLTPPCVFVGQVPVASLDAEGSFELTFTVDTPAFTTGSPDPAERCDPTCELVAQPPYDADVRLPFAFDSGSP